MVAGKMKVAMGLQKSPLITPKSKQQPPQANSSPKPAFSSSASSGKQQPSNQKGAVFSRSFGVYFPRSSAQVQPRPPDVTELLHLVEELRERESRLKTELLEQKLLRESIAILPVLEDQIANKDTEIEKSRRKIDCLEDENERLRQEIEVLHMEISRQNGRFEDKIKSLEAQIVELKKANDELASATAQQKQQEDVSLHKSMSIKCLRKTLSSNAAQSSFNNSMSIGNNAAAIKTSDFETKREDNIASVTENEKPRHSRCNSEEIADASEGMMGIRSRVPRVPRPPPRPSSSLLGSSLLASSLLSSLSSPSYGSLSDSAERALAEISNIPPPPPPPPVKMVAPPPPQRQSTAAPPPPPPPPPAKGLKAVPAKVRRVPEVVEFYHSLMRRDSRREAGGGAAETPAPGATAKDMIGEIENRSSQERRSTRGCNR